MANMFQRPNPNFSPRQLQENRYTGSRMNLLLLIVITTINLVLLATGSGYYFLFSAFIPYLLVNVGMGLCGMFPEEYYEGEFASMEFFEPTVFYVLLAVSLVLLAVYLLAWLLSRGQKGGWLIFALVFFCVDTAAMLLLSGISADMILDYVLHAWVIYELAVGVSAYMKLKNMPLEEPVYVEAEPVADTAFEEVPPPAETDRNNEV